jgi:hypothetical protein
LSISARFYAADARADVGRESGESRGRAARLYISPSGFIYKVRGGARALTADGGGSGEIDDDDDDDDEDDEENDDEDDVVRDEKIDDSLDRLETRQKSAKPFFPF